MTIKEIQETFREIRELRKRGGARPGSGRKPVPPEEKRVQMVVTIEKETRDKLKARAKAEHVRVGRLIDEWMGES